MKVTNLNISGIDILVLIFAIPVLYSVLNRLMRIALYQTKVTKKILLIIDNVFLKKHLHTVSSILFLIVFFVLFILQKNFAIHFVESTSSGFNLIEIYGFVIGILSMYGIYIGFLQFVIGDSEKERYLGVNKLKYLTDKSMWYQITQTKPFLVTLFILIIFPLVIINTQGDMQNNLIYIWQSGLILVLCIYIFLIGMSLEILRIMFLIKDEVDSNLELNIKKTIRNKYYDQFNKMYKTGFQHEHIKRFFKSIEYDLQKVNKIEIDEFLETVFSNIEKNIASSSGNYKKIRNVKLYNAYKNFINEKWFFLISIQEDIAFSFFKELIQNDTYIFDLLIKENHELFEEKEKFPLFLLKNKKIENAHKYLFDKLLVKAILNDAINELCEEIKETTRKIKNIDSEKEVLINYYTDVEKYKWGKIFDEYLKTDASFGLPKFRRKETRTISSFDVEGEFETFISDYDNYELYSEVLFNYLSRTYGYLTEEQVRNESFITLIQTMDKEDRVAYAIYQLLYPDKNSFSKNRPLFEEQIRKEFNYLYTDKDKEELFLKAAQKVAKLQDVGHRLTGKVLKEIFYNRNKPIKNVTYFEKFYYSRISIVRWLFFQNLLTSDNQYTPHTPRILISNKKDIKELRIIEGICTSYLREVDKYPELYKDFVLRTTIEKLLEDNPLESNSIFHDVGVVGFMCYELLIINVWDRKNAFLKAIKYEDESYCFMSLGIFEYFVWKLIDVNYEDVFQNKGILEAMKHEGNRNLRMNNMTINEFVESIYNKLKDSNIISVGKIELELVVNNLTQILL